jgi:hypothetical protein
MKFVDETKFGFSFVVVESNVAWFLLGCWTIFPHLLDAADTTMDRSSKTRDGRTDSVKTWTAKRTPGEGWRMAAEPRAIVRGGARWSLYLKFYCNFLGGIGQT